MKKITLILMYLFILCVFTIHADNEKPIKVSQLPAAAQQFIKQHFADRKVALAKMETEFVAKNYEVIFIDGGHIDFDSKGNWKEIECKSSSVPVAVIPTQIMEYVSENHSNTTIKKLKKDRREYEVKLSNRVELSFDMKFNLTDIDM